MRTRIIVGVIGIPLVLIPIWLGGLWSVALFLLIALLGGYEFYNMLTVGGYRPARWPGLVWLAALVLHSWQPQVVPLTALLSVGLIGTLIYSLYQPEMPVNVWMATSIVAIYIGLMMGQAVSLRLMENGLWLLLFGIFVTWTNDTAAYFTGVGLGRRKLWPRLSPKKTWEGTIGGWVGAGLIGGLLAWLMPLGMSIAAGILIGGVAGVLALFGDLSISMAKRQVGVKDTGALIPGHGGVLDRIDSLLFVLPFVYQTALLLTP